MLSQKVTTILETVTILFQAIYRLHAFEICIRLIERNNEWGEGGGGAVVLKVYRLIRRY